MQALGKKVIIRPDVEEEVTSSGIIKVEVRSKGHASGTVVASGPHASEVQVGDHIFYSPLTYDEIKQEDEAYHVVDIDDVFALIE